MPIVLNLYNRPLWLTKSNAELKSSETILDSVCLLRKDCGSCVSNKKSISSAKAFSEAKRVLGKTFIESTNLKNLQEKKK